MGGGLINFVAYGPQDIYIYITGESNTKYNVNKIKKILTIKK